MHVNLVRKPGNCGIRITDAKGLGLGSSRDADVNNRPVDTRGEERAGN